MKLDDRNHFFLYSPFFISMATAAKFVLPICLAYLVPLDVDVTGNITANLCEVWSEFNIFLHLGYHGNGRHFEFCSTHLKLPHTMVDIPTKFQGIKKNKNLLGQGVCRCRRQTYYIKSIFIAAVRVLCI